MDIIVDSREPDKIFELIKQQVTAIKETLPYGDFKIGDWFFSRKTLPDMLTSLNSGHIHDEITRIIENSEKNALIIECEETQFRAMNDSMLARLFKTAQTLHFVIPVIYTAGMEDTVARLLRFREKIIKGELGTMKRRPVLIGDSNDIVAFYAQIPGVGIELAERIFKVYPKPYDFLKSVNNSYIFDKIRWKSKKEYLEQKWNAKIQGIGEDKAACIEAFLLDGDVIK